MFPSQHYVPQDGFESEVPPYDPPYYSHPDNTQQSYFDEAMEDANGANLTLETNQNLSNSGVFDPTFDADDFHRNKEWEREQNGYDFEQDFVLNFDFNQVNEAQQNNPSQHVTGDEMLTFQPAGTGFSVAPVGQQSEGLINNHGIPPSQPALDMELEDVQEPFESRQTAPVQLSQSSNRDTQQTLPKPAVSANLTVFSSLPQAVQASGTIPASAAPATGRKRAAAKKRERITQNQGKIKWPRKDVYDPNLHMPDGATARATVTKLIPLNIEDDDRDEVVAHPEYWIPLITATLKKPYEPEPKGEQHQTDAKKKEWARWQEDHENKMWSKFVDHASPVMFAQACARLFYDLVVEAHFPGGGLHPVNKMIGNGGPDLELKCSERLNKAIAALEGYAIVRYDFVCRERMHGLAASPDGFVSRKVDNMWANLRKKEDALAKNAVERQATKAGAASKQKSQGKAEKGKAAESDHDDAVEDDDDETMAPPPKRRKKVTIPDDEVFQEGEVVNDTDSEKPEDDDDEELEEGDEEED